MSAVPPIMVKSPNNPDGLPISVFDGLRKSLAANRAQFYRDFASTVFYGFNRPGAKPMDGVIENWWRQGMMGGAKAHYDGIKAFCHRLRVHVGLGSCSLSPNVNNLRAVLLFKSREQGVQLL